jgi:hypothetical protein
MSKEHGDSSSGSLPILGPSKSTVAGDHSAERLASIFRRMKGFLPTLHHDDFVGDNLQWYIARYLKWLCTRLIPHSFNDELEPTNPRNKKCLLTRSLLIYVGKHLHYIRTTFGHPDFDKLGSNEYPTWWTSYRANFTRECDKFQMINAIGDDVEFGDLDVRPLYRVIENTSSDDPLSECDLLHWFTNIMKDAKVGNDAIETAAWVFMTADSVARGGEVKFQVFKE